MGVGVSWARPASRAFNNVPSSGHKVDEAGLLAMLGFYLAGKGRRRSTSVGPRIPAEQNMDRVLCEEERNVHIKNGCVHVGEHAGKVRARACVRCDGCLLGQVASRRDSK